MERNNLRKVREDRMMSKAELARKAGLSVLTIDRIEKYHPCRYATKRKILEALDISIENRAIVFPPLPTNGTDEGDTP